MASTPPSPNDLTRQQLDELDTLLQRMLSLPISTPKADKSAPTPPPEMPSVATMRGTPRTSPAGYPLPPDWDESATPPSGWRTDPPAGDMKPPRIADEASDSDGVMVPAVALAGSDSIQSPTRSSSPNTDTVTPAPTPPTNLAVHPAEESRPAPPVDPEPLPRPRTVRGVDAPLVPVEYDPPFGDSLSDAHPESGDEAEATPEPTPVPADAVPPVPAVMMPVYVANQSVEVVLGLLGPIGATATRPAVKQVLGWAGVVMLTASAVWTACGLGLVPGF